MSGQSRHADRPAPKSVLARGLSLLDAFGAGEPELSLAEIAARSGLPKPTAHRLLAELVEWGALERSSPGHYRLATKLFRLGQLVPRHRVLRQAALPHLEQLYEASHENVHLAVPDNVYTLFLEKLTGRESMSIRSRVGGRMPSHCTATGKVFLAWGGRDRLRRVVDAGLPRLTPRTIVLPGLLHQDLERTIARGLGINREEAEPGVSAVAAPVLGARGEVVAALSVTGRSHRLDLDRVGGLVRAAANAVSASLPAVAGAQNG
ncbi:IclR family transcriptional regulator [Prauserella endophytica]|uniref:IclR family transcriptional regulator n=1 Tax=Prauserella endophytica TaxID=1592324 RepID=A0ABY2RY27_9PSEU|nr:IclR family transcriptional regulator [Prauserella endophytica]TKG64879.1 IclR family transcriptional regulator [Prauserella endophytica]